MDSSSVEFSLRRTTFFFVLLIFSPFAKIKSVDYDILDGVVVVQDTLRTMHQYSAARKPSVVIFGLDGLDSTLPVANFGKRLIERI